MTGAGSYDVGTAAADPLPARAPGALRVGSALMVDALAALAAADSHADVAAAALPLLAEQPGVRACAVVARDGSRALVLASAGYDCSSMAAGTVLPLDAGLPVTEAVRTGRLVVRGSGPSWVAVPFGSSRRSGALLLSLTVAPPAGPEDTARLHRLTRALGDALGRAAAQERAFCDLALVTSELAAPAPTAAGVVVRSTPREGPVGGDVAVAVDDGRGGRWVLVADVCGNGLTAAVLAHTVHTAATAVAPWVDGPAGMLAAIEAAVLPQTGPCSFVTAAVAHLHDGVLRIASAGHPAPLVLTADDAWAAPVAPGEPLALSTGAGGERETWTGELPSRAVLVLHSDGLTDRRERSGGVRSVDPLRLLRAVRFRDDLDALADAVLAAAEREGPATDDVTLLLHRR